MTFYQELQLSSVASKQLIKATEDKKERYRHILIYNFKVYLVMAFCVAVVSLYSHFTGNNNSVVGVTVLLAVLVLRQADFGIRTTHGLASIVGIFGILIAGPKLSNMVSPIPAFFINIVCILLLMILGCHNVIMYNHSTFVLGYLLLQGYDVTGQEYLYRVAGLLVGMVLCMQSSIRIRRTDRIEDHFLICSASSISAPQETDGTFVFHWLFPVQCYLCHCLDFREQCGRGSQACLFVFHSRMTVKNEQERELHLI